MSKVLGNVFLMRFGRNRTRKIETDLKLINRRAFHKLTLERATRITVGLYVGRGKTGKPLCW